MNFAEESLLFYFVLHKFYSVNDIINEEIDTIFSCFNYVKNSEDRLS